MESVANNYSKSEKSATTALLLCMFLGGLGAHRFYAGKIGTGILMLVTFGGFGIWMLIDIVNIAYSNFTDANGRYLEFNKRTDQTSRQVRNTLLLIFSIFFVFIFAMIFLIFTLTSGLTNVAREQLSALRAHDFNKAYSYTSTEFKKSTTEAEFEKFVQSYPILLDNKDSTFTNREIKNDQGMIAGTIEGKDGSTVPIIYYFVKEDGQWKILAMEVKGSQMESQSKASEEHTDEEEAKE